MKKSSKIIIGVFAGLVVLGAIGSMNEDSETKTNDTQIATNESNESNQATANTDDNKPTKEEQKSDEVTEEPTKEPTAEPTAEPTESAKEDSNVYNVGDKAVSDDVTISYLSCGDYKESNDFLQPKDGYKYIYFEFEFENTSKSDYYISTFNCYADGYDCESYYGGEDISSTFTISSGRKAKNTLYYQVPADASEIEVEYSLNLWTSEKLVFQFK